MNFKDKVVVITGGTSGIGKQAAIEFSRKGAHVVAFTVDKEEVCKEAIKEIGNDASYIYCDVSKEEDVKKAIEEVVLKYGRLDCAFNNAGIGPDGVRMPYESLTEISEKTWDLVVDVDMKGVFLCLKYELLQMQKQGFGTIVNTASIEGIKWHLDLLLMVQLKQRSYCFNRNGGIRKCGIWYSCQCHLSRSNHGNRTYQKFTFN